MAAPDVTPDDASRLRSGQPPTSSALLKYLQVPQPGWVDFVEERYLNGFIADGGAKCKVLVGSPGTGKTHLLRLLAATAREDGYLTCELSARSARLFPMNCLFGAIMHALDIEALARKYADSCLDRMGYKPSDVPPGKTFFAWATTDGGRAESELMRDLKEHIEKLITEGTPNVTFATVVITLALHYLGARSLPDQDLDALHRWAAGDQVRLPELRHLFVFEKVDRNSARSCLFALLQLIRRVDYKGLIVCVDDMECLTERSPDTGRWMYGRALRDEAYEVIRELVDDTDRLHHVLFVFAGRRPFFDDPKLGVSSYEALRLRLAREVRGERFNQFADTVDLDEAHDVGFVNDEALGTLAAKIRALAMPPSHQHEAPSLSEGAERATPRRAVWDALQAIAQEWR